MSALDTAATSNGDAILEVKDLTKIFVSHRGHAQVHAVDGISFSLRRGEILGLVGESGCGKTTTGKLIMRLVEPSSGTIAVDGSEAVQLTKEEDFAYRRRVQMIFQDPYASMNPHFKVKDVLEEPLLIHKIGATRAERMDMVAQVLEKVKMTPVEEFMDRHPHMLSGGQRQRVATARTLILRPQIIVADEPVSMIDLSTRAEILHLMKTIQQDMELSFVYITHDISTARYFTDRIAVMYLGRIVEIGSQDDLIDHPRHPYTKALIEAVCEPVSGRVGAMRELNVKGEIPSAANVPPGCRFHPRCMFATPECSTEAEPELAQAVGSEAGHMVACRRYEEL